MHRPHAQESGAAVDAVSGQGVLKILLLMVQRGLEEKIHEMNRRSETEIGQITARRGFVSSKPTIAGTRIPVSAIQNFAADGYSVEEIMAQYPSLEPEDVRAAIEFGQVA